jgi:hypothetical protein
MSILGVCFWNGGYDEHSLPHGEGSMTLFSSVTGLARSVEQCTMCHGVNDNMALKVAPSPGPACPPRQNISDPDVPTMVASHIADAWLNSDARGCSEQAAGVKVSTTALRCHLPADR